MVAGNPRMLDVCLKVFRWNAWIMVYLDRLSLCVYGEHVHETKESTYKVLVLYRMPTLEQILSSEGTVTPTATNTDDSSNYPSLDYILSIYQEISN